MEKVFFARQPILDVNNNTYGYELLYRNQPGVNAYTGNNGDVSTADVINNAFFVDNITSVLGGKKAFVNFTGNLIKRGVPKMISSDILVVELLESVMADAEIIRRCIELKKLGYIIALDDYEYSENTKALFELADIIKLDFHTSREAVERTAEKCITYNKIMLAGICQKARLYIYAGLFLCKAPAYDAQDKYAYGKDVPSYTGSCIFARA